MDRTQDRGHNFSQYRPTKAGKERLHVFPVNGKFGNSFLIAGFAGYIAGDVSFVGKQAYVLLRVVKFATAVHGIQSIMHIRKFMIPDRN